MRIGIHPKPAGRSKASASGRKSVLQGPAKLKKTRIRKVLSSVRTPGPVRPSGRTAGRSSGKTAWIRPALNRKLSVIISACNEETTLGAVLKEAERLKPEEIIVVLNGCVDNSFRRARKSGMATIVHCPEAAGHDIGRAIGAKLSRGDILLFLDGDMAIPAPELYPFAAAVDQGADVALNNLNPLLPVFGECDDVTRCKMFLNTALGREDLGSGSMTAVPHALSRRALELIGPQTLAVPPKAQAAAIMQKLCVKTAGTVNVIKRNRIRKGNTGAGNGVEQLIIGDHAEALAEGFARGETGLLWRESGTDSRRLLAAWRNGI